MNRSLVQIDDFIVGDAFEQPLTVKSVDLAIVWDSPSVKCELRLTPKSTVIHTFTGLVPVITGSDFSVILQADSAVTKDWPTGKIYGDLEVTDLTATPPVKTITVVQFWFDCLPDYTRV